MSDKDKLRAELLQDLKNEGADESSLSLYENVIRIITGEKQASVPAHVIEKTRAAVALKPRKILRFNLIARAAVALIAFALMLGVALIDYKANSGDEDKVFIAATDTPYTDDIDGVEYIAYENTRLVQKIGFMELEKGEVLINLYNNESSMIIQVSKMNVKLLPGSIAIFQNSGNYSQVAVFKGQAEVSMNEQTQMLDANTDKKVLYHEQDAFSQPVEGSPEKYAELLNNVKRKAQSQNSSNTQNWINSNKSRNLIIDQFIWDANKNRSYLVKRVKVSENGENCTVVFNIDNKEKRFEVKKGANIGSWIVTNMSKLGFELHDGENKIAFTFAN